MPDRYLAPLTEKEKSQPWYRNLNQKPRQFEMYTKSEMGYQILALALPIYDLQEQEMVGILKMELFPSRIFRVLIYNDYFKIKVSSSSIPRQCGLYQQRGPEQPLFEQQAV